MNIEPSHQLYGPGERCRLLAECNTAPGLPNSFPAISIHGMVPLDTLVLLIFV